MVPFPRSKKEIPNKSSAFWPSDDAFNEILCSMVIEDSRERKECAMQDHGDMSTARSWTLKSTALVSSPELEALGQRATGRVVGW
jgi:hypothetical protein